MKNNTENMKEFGYLQCPFCGWVHSVKRKNKENFAFKNIDPEAVNVLQMRTFSGPGAITTTKRLNLSQAPKDLKEEIKAQAMRIVKAIGKSLGNV